MIVPSSMESESRGMAISDTTTGYTDR
jgi:hypothetical protein